MFLNDLVLNLISVINHGTRVPRVLALSYNTTFFSYLILQVLMSFLRFGDFLITDFINTRGFLFDWGKSCFRRFVSSTSSNPTVLQPLPFTGNTKLHVRDRIESNIILLFQFL